MLQADGVRLHAEGASTTLALQYGGGAYRGRQDEAASYSRQELLDLVAEGDLLLTITARLGRLVDFDHLQPTLRPHELPILPMFPGGRPADFPELHAAGPMRLRGEHIQEGLRLHTGGRRRNPRGRRQPDARVSPVPARFISPEADGYARITFTLAQSDVDVQIDDVGPVRGAWVRRAMTISSPSGARSRKSSTSGSTGGEPP